MLYSVRRNGGRWITKTPRSLKFSPEGRRELSASVVLLTFAGRKSGGSHAVPVGYVLEGEDIIRVTGRNWSTWWKNLLGGAPARVRQRGRELEGGVEIVENEEAVARDLGAFLPEYRSTARRYGVRLEPDGPPESEGVATAARGGGGDPRPRGPKTTLDVSLLTVTLSEYADSAF